MLSLRSMKVCTWLKVYNTETKPASYQVHRAYQPRRRRIRCPRHAPPPSALLHQDGLAGLSHSHCLQPTPHPKSHSNSRPAINADYAGEPHPGLRQVSLDEIARGRHLTGLRWNDPIIMSTCKVYARLFQAFLQELSQPLLAGFLLHGATA